jgi:hypothetical protein
MISSLVLLKTITFTLTRRKKCQKISKICPALAWNLLSNICAIIVENLKNIIHSESFIARHRKSPTDFIRKRKLPFHLLICILLNHVKGSYQDELDQFFKALNAWDVAKRVVSKVAFAAARMKLKFQAFIELNEHLISSFEKFHAPKTWCGYRLIAIDGSTLQLPKIDPISKHFGVWNVTNGDPRPMARISQLFDVLNKLSIKAVIDPKSVDEREQAVNLFLALMPYDLVLLDRGYPSFWIFKALIAVNAAFCARMPTNFKAVQQFKNSGKPQRIITLRPTPNSISKCREMGFDPAPIQLRLIRIELVTGEVEVLATTLLDRNDYPADVFKDLYFKRWPIETDYNYLKNWIEMENFTGKSVESVYQDFHARILSKNLTSVLSFPAQEILEREGRKEKYEHQINFVQALSKSKHVVSLLFQRSKEKIAEIIVGLLEIFLKTTEPIRPDRNYPRRHKTQKRKFYLCYKRAA